MDISNWVLIGTTLFLGIIAIWGDQIKRLIFSPKIAVSFEETPPYCHKTSYRSTSIGLGEVNEPVFFFRFRVDNIGASKLKNCEVKLDQLWIYNSAGKPQKFSGWNEVSLVWASGRRSIIDLDPHRKGYCNIGHIASKRYQELHEQNFIDLPGSHEKQLRFFFELAEIPYSQPNCLLFGKYAIKLMIYAENAPPRELWFEISWSAKWQDNETEMFRELVVNPIGRLE
jgi:hypothetical protein